VTASPPHLQIHSQLDNHELAAFLLELTNISRPIIKQWFGASPDIEIKADSSPVTIADKTVEVALRDAIAARFPGDDILGEEHPVMRGDGSTGYQWVIDPIDGTKAFICGKPTFGTLVGLVKDNRPIAGLCDMPMLNEAYVGVGDRCFMNGNQIMVGGATALSGARLATTSAQALSEHGLAIFNLISAEVGITSYGGDCHNYALLAAGHLDLVIEDSLAAHDIMGVVPVIESAGGIVTDFAGVHVRYPETTSLLCAATPALHAAALAIITANS
jgi:histidinol phosphatase-like enzyme (inositol monophosphatase family)